MRSILYGVTRVILLVSLLVSTQMRYYMNIQWNNKLLVNFLNKNSNLPKQTLTSLPRSSLHLSTLFLYLSDHEDEAKLY